MCLGDGSYKESRVFKFDSEQELWGFTVLRQEEPRRLPRPKTAEQVLLGLSLRQHPHGTQRAACAPSQPQLPHLYNGSVGV